MGLQRGWWGTDLGKFRPCDGTYAFYAADTVPPLDDTRFKGAFQWLAQAANTPKPSKELAQLQKTTTKLPASLVTFFSSPPLRDQIPSCTACEWDLSPEAYAPQLPGGGTAVRVLRDQQDCLFWYVVVGGDLDGKVVCSPIPWHDEAAVKEDEAVVVGNTVVVADSFEAFVYRFWIENVLWDLVQSKGPYTKEQQAYLNHYTPN